jgi:hypothetical protein
MIAFSMISLPLRKVKTVHNAVRVDSFTLQFTPRCIYVALACP